jgi:hypothetical protein
LHAPGFGGLKSNNDIEDRAMDQPGSALLKTRLATAVTAMIALVVAGVSLVAFVLDLLVTPEMGALIISFVVCGAGLTTGLVMLRRLSPRREPISLFAGSAVVFAAAKPLTEAHAPVERLSIDSQTALVTPGINKADPIPSINRNKSVASYTARDNSGAMCLVMAIGVSLILGTRLSGGWEFLVFAVLAGLLVALALHWIHEKQNFILDSHTIPTAGGIVSFICLAGVGAVMIRSHLMRIFLGLAICAGSAIALLLFRAREKNGSSISLV